jgi:hypothetical protein
LVKASIGGKVKACHAPLLFLILRARAYSVSHDRHQFSVACKAWQLIGMLNILSDTYGATDKIVRTQFPVSPPVVSRVRKTKKR